MDAVKPEYGSMFVTYGPGSAEANDQNKNPDDESSAIREGCDAHDGFMCLRGNDKLCGSGI